MVNVGLETLSRDSVSHVSYTRSTIPQTRISARETLKDVEVSNGIWYDLDLLRWNSMCLK